MTIKRYNLDLYNNDVQQAWVSRASGAGADGASVSSAEIENGNQLKLTLSDGTDIMAAGTISTGHFSDSVSQSNSIFFNNGNVGLGPDADFAAKLHISGTILSTEAANFGGTNFTDGVIIDSESIKIIPSSQPAKIELYCESSGSHKVTLQAPAHADFSGDVNFTLPNSNGSANQVLVTDGSGATSWVDGSTVTGSSQAPTFLIDFNYTINPNSSNNSTLNLPNNDEDNNFFIVNLDINTLDGNSDFDRTSSTSFVTKPADNHKYFMSGFIPCDSSISKVQMVFSTFSENWGWPSGITMLIFKGIYTSGSTNNIQWTLVSRINSGPVSANSIVFSEEVGFSSGSFSKGDLWCAAFYSPDIPNSDVNSDGSSSEFANVYGNLYFSESAYQSGTNPEPDYEPPTDDPEIVYNSALFEITEVTVNELSRIAEDETKIKFLVKGMNALNYDSFIDFSNPRISTGAPSGWMADPSDIATDFDFLPNDYTLITHSWTVGNVDVHHGPQVSLKIQYSDRDDGFPPLEITTYVNVTADNTITIAADDQPGLGYIDLLPAVESGDRTGVVISPPYFNAEDGILSFSENHTWGPNLSQPDIQVKNNGLRWEIKAYEAVSLSDRNNGAPINYMRRLIAGGGTQGFGAFVARWTQNGQGYFLVDVGDSSAGTSGHGLSTRMNQDPQVQGNQSLWASPVDGTPQINAEIISTDDGYGIFSFGFWDYTFGNNTSVPFPDENTTFNLYIGKDSSGLLGVSGERSDIKIQIDIGDYISGKPAAENMTVKYFRNHNTSDTEAPVWTEYNKLYLCGKQPGEMASDEGSGDEQGADEGSNDSGSTDFDPIGAESHSQFTLNNISTNLSMVSGQASSITLDVSGIDSSNYNKYIDFSSVRIYGNWNPVDDVVVTQFSEDYSTLTYSWTNEGDADSGDDESLSLVYGTSSNYALSIYLKIDTATGELSQAGGVGSPDLIPSVVSGERDGLVISPAYLKQEDNVNDYVKAHQWSSWRRQAGTTSYYHYGPRWTVRAHDISPFDERSNYRNYPDQTVSGLTQNAGFGNMYAKWTSGGVLYHEGIASTGRFATELEGHIDGPASRVKSYPINNNNGEVDGFTFGFYNYRSAQRSTNTVPQPDENTTVYLYIDKAGSAGFTAAHDDFITDVKIEIDMGPFVDGEAVAANMTARYYRNHNLSNTGNPYWVQYDRLYLGGQPLKDAVAGPPILTSLNGFDSDGEIEVTFEDILSNESTDIEYTVNDGGNWTSFGAVSSPAVISGLVNETEYTVRLRAINRFGASGPSNSLSSRPTPNLMYPPDFTVSSDPSGLRINSFSMPESSDSIDITRFGVRVTKVSDGSLIYEATISTNMVNGWSLVAHSHGIPLNEEVSVEIKSMNVSSGDESVYSAPVNVVTGS